MTEVRVLIVEDEPVIAENIALCLNNNDFMVSGIAYDNEEARKQLIQNTRYWGCFTSSSVPAGAQWQ